MKTHKIINAISNGLYQNRYEEWKNHEDANVRLFLAKKGYFPEHFANDVNIDVQRAALKAHPECVDKFLGDEQLVEYVYDVLETQQHPDINVLRRHLQDCKTVLSMHLIKILQLKLDSYGQASTLEKTMDRYQLYKTNSPLWAKDVRMDFIEDVNYMESLIDTNEIPDIVKDQWRKTVLAANCDDSESWNEVLNKVLGDIEAYLDA